MFKCAIFSLLAILYNLLSFVPITTQDIVLEQQLLIGYRDENSKSPVLNYRLMTLDINGNREPFSHITVEGRQTYISMDNTKISSRGIDGNLLVFNHLGDVIFQYDFPVSDKDRIWSEWYVWGWADTQTLVLSRQIPNQWQFYTLNVLDNANELQSFDRLNSSPIVQYMQNIDEIEEIFEAGIASIIYFSPNFEILLTPPFVVDQPLDPFSPEHLDNIFIWDLTLQSEYPIVIITNGLPWWYDWTLFIPKWSKDSKSLLFAGFANNDDLSLYRYDDFNTVCVKDNETTS